MGVPSARLLPLRDCDGVDLLTLSVHACGATSSGPAVRANQALTRVQESAVCDTTEMTITLLRATLLFTMASVAAWTQVNAGEQKPEPTLPFTMTTVATFRLPWRLAFLPDGRMLVTEKPGPVWLVSQKGEKVQIENTPPAYWQGQNGMMGVFLS